MAGRNLVLIGFMGVGKSTLGKLCATELGFAFRDSDRVIEQQQGCSIARLFATHGEPIFREQERQVISQLAATERLVIATGGGAILDPANASCLRASGFVVLLTASTETILRRVGNGRARPLLADAEDPSVRIRHLLAERLPHYTRAAHAQVETTDKSPRAIATEIVALYRQGQAAPEIVMGEEETRQEVYSTPLGGEI